ncbi:MAG TPA: hypothetical protein VK392_11150 [Thermoanaerobaculia bacterium]|nr:hypothetical protein [Thermoanaerobaculia bacterium]
MIEYSETPGPSVRCVESDLAGRRVAAHAAPYSGQTGGPPFRFDPLERRLVLRRPSGRVAVGPADPGEWARAVARCAAGPVVVGPGSTAEEIRGVQAAAAEGVARTGRGLYLLDPDPAIASSVEPGAVVALVAWAPGDGDLSRRLAAPVAAGFPAGALLPIFPGWTDDAAFLDAWFASVVAAGAQFVAAVPAADGGEERRLLVEARALFEPEAADEFFETVHHGDWAVASRDGLRRFRDAAAVRGMPAIPPRPVGSGEPAGNAAAAARLEERAVEVEDDEHRFALLHAAARWIDESGRDLAPVVREGNFGKVFPFGALAAEAEAVFRIGVRS